MKHLTKLILLFIFLLPGCTHMMVNKALKEMRTTFDSVMGLSTEEIIIKLGAPQQIDHIGNLQIYHYYKDYGSRTNIFANQGYGAGRSWQSYDKAEITFKNDRAISWKGYVQR